MKRHLILVAASLIIGVMIGEGLLRLVGYSPRVLAVNPHYSEKTWSKEDERLGWTNKPGTIRSIEAGHALMGYWPDGARVSWSEQSKPASRHVYLVGGSFTQGYGVADEETYAYRLNALIPDVMFHNFGVGGYGTYQSLLRLKQALSSADYAATPDLVIYAYIGDHEQRNVARHRWVTALTDSAGHYLVPPHVTIANGKLTEHPMEIVYEWPLETRSALITLLHDAALRLRFLGRSAQRRAATDELIRQMQQVTLDSGSRFLVVLLNNVKDGLVPYLKEHGIPYLDCVNPAFETDPVYRVGGEGHPSALQHEQWSHCIKRYLDQTQMLRRTEATRQ
jgi:hypothetical protein